jgi:hypothetical protein
MTGRKLAIYSYRFSLASISQLSTEDVILHKGQHLMEYYYVMGGRIVGSN